MFEHSKSQIIAYVIGNAIYIFDFIKLWEHVKKLNAGGKVRRIKGGDGWRNSLILMPLDEILPLGEKVEL